MSNLTQFQTHVGRVREHNEDACLCDDVLGLWVVADGMGGHLAGECASRIAIETIAAQVQSHASLVTAIKEAHQAIVKIAKDDSEKADMGSTVVAAQLLGDTLDVAWVGDSRAYLWNGKRLFRISRDHSVVQDLMDRGVFNEQEAWESPHRGMITQAVGPALNKPLKVASLSLPVFKGQIIMLCSDGLTDLVIDQDIATILEGYDDLSLSNAALIKAALDAGGTDNVTVICIQMGEKLPSDSYFKQRRQRRLLES